MYKFISISLSIVLVIACIVFKLVSNRFENENRILWNTLAKTEKMQKETETTYSRRGIELENIKSKNKELQNIIDNRNENILALTKTNIRIRNKYFEIKNAKQLYVDENGNSLPHVTDGSYCDMPSDNVRIKIEFEQTEEPLKVKGFTLTNPAYAQLQIEWIRDLKLQLILTKTQENTFRIYIDSDNSDIIPTDLKLIVDSNILKLKWYEKISLNSNLSVGSGIHSSFGLAYDFWENFSIGPSINFVYDGNKLKKLYGINSVWYPWK